MLAALTGLADPRARETYDRLRASYNSCRRRDSPPVPPLEEWQGVSSICEDPRSCCRCGEISTSVGAALFLTNELDAEVRGKRCFG